MLYAMVPATLLIINIILNWDSLKNYGFREKNLDEAGQVHVRYNEFILSAICYFIVDMMWGILYEFNESMELFPVLYAFTVLYFMMMFLTMLTWTRSVVAYLDRGRRRSTVLLYGVWTMFGLVVLCLILNQFYPFMFSFNAAYEYIGEFGRNIAFILQIAFYIAFSAYMLHVAHKSIGRQKNRYNAVALTSIVLGVFLVFQIVYTFYPFYAVGLMIGICLIHSFVQLGAKKENDIHNNIALAMAEDYAAIFYIEIKSGEYLSFDESLNNKFLHVSSAGKDFFRESREKIDEYVYPDDKKYAKRFFHKEAMLKNLEGRRSFSFKYRIIIDDEPRYFLFTVMRDSKGQYIILYVKDIEDELNAEKALKENQKKTITFGQIAESLASNYDEIYYVNIEYSNYVGYEVNSQYGQLEISRSGDDFFSDSIAHIKRTVHNRDRDQVYGFINKDNLISTLENHKDCSIDFRIIIDGKTRFTRMIVRKTSDGTHFIICVEDIDAEVQREKQQLRALKTAKELARRDELTGVKNMTAYKELEKSAQGNIDNGMDYLDFGLIVCDANNLKQINDTQGHTAGDEYIKESARLICDIFAHSPVFRVGGDEFVVFLRGYDYASRHELMDRLRAQVRENKQAGTGVILSAGMSEYRPEIDSFVSDIFDRADKEMYEDKQRLKS